MGRRTISLFLFAAPLAFFGVRHRQDNDRLLLPGATSSGHHQIESQCGACHTPWGGVSQDACLRCHGESLRARDDSHAPAKFDDPGKAADLAVVDARSCIACHREHRPEARVRGSVTATAEICLGCHASVGADRPSHAAFGANSCASAGCHNYHDNRTLNRDFLTRHRGDPPLWPEARVPAARPTAAIPPVAEGPAPAAGDGAAVARAEWAASAHARASVGCQGCHPSLPPGWSPEHGLTDISAAGWKVPDLACATCHEEARAGFLAGKHGMRAAVGLTALSPGLARAAMRSDAGQQTVGCTSCHGAHRFDRTRAAVEACEGCHADQHTLAYRASPHFLAWQREQGGQAGAGTGVSCATCHLPRRLERAGAGDVARVQHNQNGNLRPSDRMARDVCLSCHGLGFTLAALADSNQVARNFSGATAVVVTGMDLVRKEHDDATR